VCDRAIVRVEKLKQYFHSEGSFAFRPKYIKAVDDVSFSVYAGETLGLVGESGCGKSTLGRSIMGLYSPTAGQIFFKDQNINKLNRRQLKNVRKKMQFIFQDPSASLNPRKTVAQILYEPLHIHQVGSKKEGLKKIAELLDYVGLSSYHLSRYPHEMSGGQKQRVGIARALVLNPSLVVCDEAVSALDVSIQAQIVNLLESLQKTFKLTYLFISHNLSVIHHISDRVGVMYLGKLVEIGSHSDVYKNTLHPYTMALISAIPVVDPSQRKERIILRGDVPSPANPPAGCRFHTRCPQVDSICLQVEPPLVQKKPGHMVACHFA